MKTSKLKFSLQEIPEGKSTRNVQIEPDDLVLGESADLKDGDVEIEFYKTDHFVQVQFDVTAKVGLICDRSLKAYTRDVEGSYVVLFEPGPVEASDNEKSAVRQIPPDELVIDINKEVRDTVMLEIPARRIHPDFLDSEGNPIEFETKKFGNSDREEDTIDPRWEKLKKLK